MWVVCHAKDSTRRQPAEVALARRGPRARGVDVVKDRTRLDAPTHRSRLSVEEHTMGRERLIMAGVNVWMDGSMHACTNRHTYMHEQG